MLGGKFFSPKKSSKFFKFFSLIFVLLLIGSFFGPDFNILAQTTQQETERQALEQELKQLEEEIKKYDQDITKTQQEKKTLQSQISLLKSQISKLNLQIQQSNVVIKDLGIQIEDTEFSIEKTSLKIEESREKLANILRSIHEEDQKSDIEILLSGKKLSDFFDNITALEALNYENQELLREIKILKVELEGQKTSLDEEKTSLENVVKIQSIQKQQSESARKDQEYYLTLTEAQYQQSLKDKQAAEKKAAEIRNRLFELAGVGDSDAPSFGEAYEIAKYVSGLTGIRPAFLLAMLTQESNLGKNVGQCYVQNTSTGDGIYIKSGAKAPKTMSPTQIPAFLNITKALGKDPFKTPVSCVMYSNGVPYGWGGAMGPSQFIPTTWASYMDRIKSITGQQPNPWNIRHAFLATGLYLKDLGGQSNEFRAAMQYFSGSSWAAWEEFYGRNALNIAAQYEQDIKQLEGK